MNEKDAHKMTLESKRRVKKIKLKRLVKKQLKRDAPAF